MAFFFISLLYLSAGIAQGNLFPFKNRHKLSDFQLKERVRECQYTTEYNNRLSGSILYFNEKGLLTERIRDWRNDLNSRSFFYFDIRDSLSAIIECYGNRETGRRDFIHNGEGRYIESFHTSFGETTRYDSLNYSSNGNLSSFYKIVRGKPELKIEYCYNSKNQLSEIFVFDDSGYITDKRFIYYFNNELVSEELFLEYNDRFYKKMIYSFPNGLLDSEIINSSGGELRIFKYRYDGHGNEIESGRLSGIDLVDKSVTEYQYDKFGNWIWRKHTYVFNNREQCGSSFRKISYY